MVGSFHTDLAAYTRLLSGSPRLGNLMQEYMRWPYGKCVRILAPSEATRDTLVRGKINPAKIQIWRRRVSTERFTPLKRSVDLRRRWGLSGGRLALLYVGRVSREKGLDLLAPPSERLRRSRIDHRLIVVGDGPMRAELRARCEGAVFTGTPSPDDVAVAMASADLFVFPSRTDTAGNVVLEAQASGLPVFVTDCGGPKENMADRISGYVCADLRAFARRIGELAWNAGRRRALSEGARQFALSRQWHLALDTLFGAYHDSVAAQPRGHAVSEPAALAGGPC